MRVAVDVRHLEMAVGTGGAQVMYHALRALRRYDDRNTYLEYHRRLGRWGNSAPGRPLRVALAAALADMVCKHIFLPIWARMRRVNLLLYFLPPCSFVERRIPQVSYILDIPEQWETPTPREWIYNRIFIRGTCRRSTHLLALSQFTARRIVETTGVDDGKISVLYPCIDRELLRPRPPEEPAPLDLPPDYVLGVLSNLSPRKNPAAYLEVYAALPPELRKRHRLVIAGAPRSLQDFRPLVPETLIEQLQPYVTVLGRVSASDLARLYAHAAAVLFPSRYEGLGLPVIESQACGVPVVAADIPAVKEVAGPLTFLAPPQDTAALADHLQELLRHPPDTAQRQAARCWTERFGYRTFAGELVRILDSLSSPHGGKSRDCRRP